MIDIKSLSVSYDNKVAINNLSVQFLPGKINGLIGPNGAGKSTLLKTCVGLISHYRGDIFFDNYNAAKNRFYIKQNAAYAPENAELLPYLSGYEFLKLIARIHGLSNWEERIDFYINLLGLTSKKNELVMGYSHGMKQKLAVASVLLSDVKFIMLDESLNGLDSVSLAAIFDHMKELKENGKLILITSHDVQLIHQWCDGVSVMNNGKIIESFSRNDLEKFLKIKDGFLNKYIELINE